MFRTFEITQSVIGYADLASSVLGEAKDLDIMKQMLHFVQHDKITIYCCAEKQYAVLSTNSPYFIVASNLKNTKPSLKKDLYI